MSNSVQKIILLNRKSFPVSSKRFRSPMGLFRWTSSASSGEEVKPYSDVPGLRSYPVIGSMYGILTHKDFDQNKLHIFWESLHKEYGPIIKMTIPLLPPTVALCSPDDIEKMYKITRDNPIREGFHSLKKVRYETRDNFFEQRAGLLPENNDEWWRVRSRVQTPMLKPRNLFQYLPQMDQVSMEFLDRIPRLQKENGEMPSNFIQEIYKWALESVGLVALSRRFGCFDPNLKEDSSQMQLINTVNEIFKHMSITEMALQLWKLFPTPSYKKLKAGHDVFLRIADAHIREAEAEVMAKNFQSGAGDHDSTLLEVLLQKEGLTRTDVVTIILDMLFAGIDTTSHTMAFTLYLLARNPNAQKRVQEEVDSVLGDGRETITEKHLQRLSFLKCCIKESMRIFPLVMGNVRVLEEDAVFSGYHIPKGTQLFAMMCVTAKDESLFSRANEFLPERWMRDKPHGPIHPYAYLPFSHGTRSCIGRRIAEQEMYTFLARAMHRFNVGYNYQEMGMITRLVSMPSEPLRFQFTERR